MSYLAGVQSGPTQAGQRVVVSGVEKIGKTTLALGAPRPLLVPMEIGFAQFPQHKTPMVTSWEGIEQLCGEIINAASARRFMFQTVVWDTGTALERLIHDKVLRTDPNYGKKNTKGLTMEAALGGYGKAYQFANELFGHFLSWCDIMAYQYGINIVITNHVFAARVVDPASGEYDTWDLLLHSPKNQRNYGKREMLTQWADLVGFLHEPQHVIVGNSGEKQTLMRAVSSNRGRVIAVDRTPAWVAGNRYRMTGEIPIPPVNGWNYLADAIYKASGIDIFNRD